MSTTPPGAQPTAAVSEAELLALDGPAFVRAAYRSVLRRDPDPGGFVSYLGRLQAGLDKRDLLVELRQSPEARARNGGVQAPEQAAPTTVEQLLEYDGAPFVRHAYALLLGRAADPSGLAHYTTQLGKGASRARVLAEIAASDEYRERGRAVEGLDRIVAQQRKPRAALTRLAARLLEPLRGRAADPRAVAATPAAAVVAPAAATAASAPRARVAIAARLLLRTLPTLEQRRSVDAP